MAGNDFVWFDDVRVRFEDMRLVCVVGDLVVPLPVVLLHPKCRLAKDSDVGRLGVPRWWAEQHGLCKAKATAAQSSASPSAPAAPHATRDADR